MQQRFDPPPQLDFGVADIRFAAYWLRGTACHAEPARLAAIALDRRELGQEGWPFDWGYIIVMDPAGEADGAAPAAER